MVNLRAWLPDGLKDLAVGKKSPEESFPLSRLKQEAYILKLSVTPVLNLLLGLFNLFGVSTVFDKRFHSYRAPRFIHVKVMVPVKVPVIELVWATLSSIRRF